MSNDLSSFANRVSTLSQNIVSNAVELQKDVAMAVLSDVVKDTPIDTGRAKSNWLVNSGSAAEGYLAEAHVVGVSGSTERENEEKTISDGDAKIRSHSGGELHVTNNLDYIGKLNEGHSKQADPLFVEAAVLRAAKSISVRSILDSRPGARVVKWQQNA